MAQVELFERMAAALLTRMPAPQIHVDRGEDKTPIERIRKFPIDEFRGDFGDPSRALDWL